MSLLELALTQAVKARARELGFEAVAIGPAGPLEHGQAFERWLDAGYAGTMTYLARTRAERVDPGRMLPGVRSVVAVAMSYKPVDDGAGAAGEDPSRRRDPADPGGRVHGPAPSPAAPPRARLARYARGRDYHDVLRPRLADLVAFLARAGGPDVQSRACVDTSAVLERELAARAGLGWVGKNTNLLAESLGSYFFIGIVLTTARLAPDGPVADRCGTCTACLDACPTEAFVASRVLDARRCISYLTIEHRGPIDPGLRPGLGDWLFGCDVCQEVCPWNRKTPAGREPAFAPAVSVESPADVLGLDHDAFRARFRGTPLLRAKRAGLLRNAAVVLGNRRDRGGVAVLQAAAVDEDPVVREAAVWALARIGGAT